MTKGVEKESILIDKILNINSFCIFCKDIDDLIQDGLKENKPLSNILQSVSTHDGMLCAAAEAKKHIAYDFINNQRKS